jgi:hypothetical protein
MVLLTESTSLHFFIIFIKNGATKSHHANHNFFHDQIERTRTSNMAIFQTIPPSWTLSPVLTTDTVEDLVQLLSHLNLKHHRVCASKELQRFFEEHNVPQLLRGTLVIHIQKGIIHRNKEAVYENESLKAELRMRIGDLDTSLKEQASVLNTTTTYLGYALAGREVMNMVINGVFDSGEEDPEFMTLDWEDIWRIQIALETVDLAKDDKISGHMCQTRRHTSQGSNILNFHGSYGESVLQSDLRRSGISFQTEVEQRESGSEVSMVATPDVLLDEPMFINGVSVHWIDSKAAFLIPGVSSPEEIHRCRMQAEKYIRLFGAGAFFWPKSGYCEGFLGDIQDLVHISRES